MILTVIYFFIAFITSLFLFRNLVEHSDVPIWTLSILPMAFALKSILRLLKWDDKYHTAPNYVVFLWTIACIILLSLSPGWALSEILFLSAILYTGSVIIELKYLNKVLSVGGLSIAIFIILHSLINSPNEAQRFSSLDQAISTFGSIGILLLLRFYLLQNKNLLDLQLNQERMKSSTATNLLMSLGHRIKNPLSAVRLQTEIITNERDGIRATMQSINEEIDGVIKLFSTFEKAVKTSIGEPNLESVLNALNYPIATNIIKLSTNPMPIAKGNFSYLSAVLNIIIDNAFVHGTGEQVLYVYLKKSGVDFAVENAGKFFSPETYRNKEGLFTPEIASNNNRIGTSLSSAYALCEAIGYELKFTERNGGGTRIELHSELQNIW